MSAALAIEAPSDAQLDYIRVLCRQAERPLPDAIYIPGALNVQDFRIRYRLYLPDIVDVGTKRWFTQQVPLMRCQDPLAWWLCMEFAAAEAARSDIPSDMLMAIAGVATRAESEARAATDKWINRDVMKNERTEAVRVPYGGGSRGQGSGGGW